MKKSSKDLFKFKGKTDPFKRKIIDEVPKKKEVIEDAEFKEVKPDKWDNERYKGKRQQQADNDIIDPLYFFGADNPNHIIKPVYNIDDHPNDKYKFAILRTTENGKYVIGDLLCFKLGDVTISTQLNNVIFVDLLNKTAFIKEFDKVTEVVNPEDPEQRQYIIMMSCIDPETDEEEYRWEAMTGRTSMYEFIADNEEFLNIDPDKSFILTENVPYKDAITVRQFVRYVKNKGMFENDGLEFDDDSQY